MNGHDFSGAAHFRHGGIELGDIRTADVEAVAANLPPGAGRPAVRRAPRVRPAATRRRHDELLPAPFLDDLRKEMRRAERCRNALSVVVYRIKDAASTGRTPSIEQLLELLQRVKRETDVIGLLGGDTVAVLCPATDEAGTKGFISKVDACSSGMATQVTAATYPSDLFHSLANGAHQGGPFAPFQASDAAQYGSTGYAVKRALDILGAGAALLICAPLMAGVALLIALGSPGPVIYRQHRLGRGGVPFVFYKFRSMKHGADDQAHRAFVTRLIRARSTAHEVGAGSSSAANGDAARGGPARGETASGATSMQETSMQETSMQETSMQETSAGATSVEETAGDRAATAETAPGGGSGSAAVYKLQADPRVTRIGRFIRKTSIDELPQLINVLKGEMSLVGPRPPIPYEASLYQPWHLRRILSITPGITGLWQVEGRSRVSFDEMVRLDLAYQRDCSLALDLKILLRTVLVVARCEGAV